MGGLGYKDREEHVVEFGGHIISIFQGRKRAAFSADEEDASSRFFR